MRRISPLGVRQRLPILIDESILGYVIILISAGHQGLLRELAYLDLARLTLAATAAVAVR